MPDEVLAVGQLTETGVDGQVSMALRCGDRAQADLSTTLWAKTPTTSAISGTEGFITVDGDFYEPTSFTVQRRVGRRWRFEQPMARTFAHQAAEVIDRGDADLVLVARQSLRDAYWPLHAAKELQAKDRTQPPLQYERAF